MQHRTTFRLLFPLIIAAPRFDNQKFNTLKTIALSFFNTTLTSALPNPDEDWGAGGKIELSIPGILDSATIIHSYPSTNETVVIAVPTLHAGFIMTDGMAENDELNLSKSEGMIRDAITWKLRPINDAIRAVENGWTRNGVSGLFTLIEPEIMYPLAEKYLPDDWT